MTIKIICPKCNVEVCKTLIEIHFIDDFKYTTCQFCGNKISEGDILSQIQEHVIEKFSEVINKSR